jgi:hypothetical protein
MTIEFKDLFKRLFKKDIKEESQPSLEEEGLELLANADLGDETKYKPLSFAEIIEATKSMYTEKYVASEVFVKLAFYEELKEQLERKKGLELLAESDLGEGIKVFTTKDFQKMRYTCGSFGKTHVTLHTLGGTVSGEIIKEEYDAATDTSKIFLKVDD